MELVTEQPTFAGSMLTQVALMRLTASKPETYICPPFGRVALPQAIMAHDINGMCSEPSDHPLKAYALSFVRKVSPSRNAAHDRRAASIELGQLALPARGPYYSPHLDDLPEYYGCPCFTKRDLPPVRRGHASR